ncbi:MAG: hypothetical protein B7Y39_07570 [Bdellovibrio sp. 28-41-41]|nr:MAG: hypothetical protein B7Y39_07570 [Bdellovibrio sp. 28-41-41]
MKQLGLTSGALYSHFKSKDDLFVQVILRELQRLIDLHSQQHKKHGTQTATKFIEYYLDERHIDGVERGCMFAAISEGLPHRRKVDRLRHAKFIFSSMVGALVMARAMKNDLVKTEMIGITKQLLLTITKDGVNYENKQ